MSGVTPRGNSFLLGLFLHSTVDDSDLTVYEFRVYAHLCRRAGDERRVWEGQKKIAACCKMSRAAAQKALYGLEEKGWIELHEKWREDGSQAPNDIIICGPPASEKGTPPPSTKAPPASEKGSIRKSIEGNPSEGIKDGAEPRRAALDPASPSQDEPETAKAGSQRTEATSSENVAGAAAGGAADVPIPAPLLALEGFAAAWGEWLSYRRKRRLSCLPETLGRQLARLAAERDPVAVIHWTIEQGYQGLVAPKNAAARTQQDANARAAQTAADVYRAITEEPDNVPF